MSYARFRSQEMAEQEAREFGVPVEPSDVYVYLDVCGKFCCCACLRGGDRSLYFDSTKEIIEHLLWHIAKDDAVPSRTIPKLQADRKKNDAWIAAQ